MVGRVLIYDMILYHVTYKEHYRGWGYPYIIIIIIIIIIISREFLADAIC